MRPRRIRWKFIVAALLGLLLGSLAGVFLPAMINGLSEPKRMTTSEEPASAASQGGSATSQPEKEESVGESEQGSIENDPPSKEVTNRSQKTPAADQSRGQSHRESYESQLERAEAALDSADYPLAQQICEDLDAKLARDIAIDASSSIRARVAPCLALAKANQGLPIDEHLEQARDLARIDTGISRRLAHACVLLARKQIDADDLQLGYLNFDKALSFDADILDNEIDRSSYVQAACIQDDKNSDIIPHVDQFTKENPRDPRGWHCLANLYVALGDMDSALKTLESAEEKYEQHKDNPNMLRLRTAIYWKRQDCPKLLESAERRVEILPDDEVASEDLARAHRACGSTN